MKQTLLRLGLMQGVTLYPSRFRELLAKQSGLPSALFHYTDDGKTQNGLPGIRMVGAKGWVGVLADCNHTDLLFQALGPAVKAVTDFCGKPVRAGIEEHEFDLIQLHYPKRYRVREMALKRRWEGAREMPVEELVAKRLLAGIERMAVTYGLDCPTPDQLGLAVDVTKAIGMPLSTTAGVTGEYVTLANAEFMLHADLKGLWFAGNLTTRGYGRIAAMLPGTVALTNPPARRSLQ